jgi:hypothetical protein
MTALTPESASLEAVAEGLGLTVESDFVPFSMSRNAKAKPKLSERSLNWRITLKRKGQAILTVDYSAGIAHCPSYAKNRTSPGKSVSLYEAEAVEWETENGSTYRNGFKGQKIEPKAADVLHSLALDAEAIEYSSFEEWASNFGYDPDSRKAEAIYQACLSTALKLRNGLGDENLQKLREAASNY